MFSFFNKTKNHDTNLFHSNAIALADATDDEWIRIVPIGNFPNHQHGAHEITADHIRQMVENFRNSGTDLLFDIDHQSLTSETRAAGWSGELEVREDGLYAKYPEFTPATRQAIENKEYRYLSPVYALSKTDKKGNKIGAVIDSIGITNRPYMDVEIDHIGNSAQGVGFNLFFDRYFANASKLGNLIARTMEENSVSVAAIANAAGRDESTIRSIIAGEIERPPDEVLASIAEALGISQSELEQTLPKQNATDMKINKEALQKLGLDEDATEDQVNQAIANMELAGEKPEKKQKKDEKPEDEEDSVEAKINALEQKLAAAEQKSEQEKAEGLISNAVKDGKILPSDKDAWMALANSDFEGTQKTLDERKKNSVMPGGLKINTDTNTKGKQGEKPDLIKNAAESLKAKIELAKAKTA